MIMASDNILEPLQLRRSRLSKLSDQVTALEKSRRSLENAIESYKSFVPDIEKAKIDRLRNRASEISLRVAEGELAKARLEHSLRETQAHRASRLTFWKLFTVEQKQLRAKVTRLNRELSETTKRLKSDLDALSQVRDDTSSALKLLSEHERFSLEGAEMQLASFGPEIERIRTDHASARVDLERIEMKVRPHIQEYERLKSEMASLNADIVKANRYDKELTAASNSYERAMVHQKCEDELGTGRPGQVINDRKGKIRRLENNIPKLERRISDELQKSERKIEHLLIDGNNACYEGQEFIGLRGISSFLKALGERYKITVVFDASIRAMLKTDSQGVERVLGASVATHIAPTKTGADEYLLKLAEKNKSTFILSNDRYAEYYDYDAVKTGRLLRFLIADGKFMANDLDISVSI